MISSQMQTAQLNYLSYTTNDLGQKINSYEKVETISVAINYNSQIIKTDNLKYKDCEYTALTDYKDFELDKEYLIVCDNIRYKVVSFNFNTFGRLTQLMLKAVI